MSYLALREAEEMLQYKSVLSSKTIAGSATSLMVLVPLIMEELKSGELQNAALAIVAAAGSLASIWGRIVAKARIRGLFK